MAMYPLIATFKYKDKNMEVELPIRVKMIELQSIFECKKCKDEGSLKDIARYCDIYKENIPKKEFEITFHNLN